MKLANNEKRTLKLLLENAKISDSQIAKKLKISSQAIGKIRKKLEKNIIESYTINIDYSKLGINVFSMAIAKLTSEGLDKGDLEIEKKLLDTPNIIQVYRLPNQNSTHIILYGFQNLEELDLFFHSPQKKRELHKFIENQQLFTFSNHSLIKNNPIDLFKRILDNPHLNQKNKSSKFQEIENFKKRL